MRVLIACEESQTVCKEFRKKGHEAYSLDIQECSGGHPEWHILEPFDEKIIYGNVVSRMPIVTQKGSRLLIPYWDLLIAHPPCTYLSNSGVRWLYPKENNDRWRLMKEGADFFRVFTTIHEKTGGKTKVGVENPIQHKWCDLPKHTQIIKPSHFGHMEMKQTCLWLYGLPPLVKTNDVTEEMKKLPYKDRAKIHYASPGPDRQKIRSKTYTGIAEAMADQWGNL